MVSSVVPCGIRAMKFCWGSAVTSIGILSNIGKSSFIRDAGDSMLVNVKKHSKRMSNSSQLGTLTGAAEGVCALGVEPSPDMVTVFPSLWKWMLSMSCALRVGWKWGIGTDGGINLEDKPFSLPVFFFFDEDPTSMASFYLFCCCSQKLTHRLAVISSSSSSLIIDDIIGLMISHY